jgi:hypothetical protein
MCSVLQAALASLPIAAAGLYQSLLSATVRSYKAVLQCGPGQYKWASGDNFQLALTAASHSVEHAFA